MLLEILPFALDTQVLRHSRLCKTDHAYLTYLMLQQHLSHLNGYKLDRRHVSASYIFSVWLRLVLYANMFTLMVLYDFCLLTVQFRYIMVYIRKVDWLCSLTSQQGQQVEHACLRSRYLATAVV
jgi:hypothetical protein